jgi:PAS domain S-box-containing protein
LSTPSPAVPPVIARASVEERRALAARVARVGVWEWDIESRTMIADDAVRGIVRQHEGQRWSGPAKFLERLPPEDRPAMEQAMRAAIEGPDPGECTVRLALPEGGPRWLYFYGQRLRGSTAAAPRVLGLVMDVTAQKRAELELAARQETLSLASSAAELCVWNWRPGEDLLTIDERFVELVGLPPGTATITLAEWQALLHPEDLPRLLELAHSLTSGEETTFDITYRLRRPGGGWRWVLDRGRVGSRNAAGEVETVYGIALDIDERRRTEMALAAERLRLDLALDASGLGLWDWDVEAARLFVDGRYCAIVGTTPEALLENPFLFHEHLHPGDRARLDQQVQALLTGQAKNLSFEGRLRRPDGQVVLVLVSGAVSARDARGKAIRTTGTLADITRSEHMRQLAGISEGIARVGSYELDLASNRLAWSEGTYRIFGMPPSYQPDRVSTLNFLAPSSSERMRETFRGAVEDGKPFDVEIEARRSDGAAIWIRMTGRVERFEERPVRIYGIVQDITARKQLERELLEVANREQQRLGSELHDGLGQELAGISMMLEALAQQMRDAKPLVAAQFERLRGLVTQSIQSTRALAHGLAPVSLSRGGLEGALRLLAGQVELAGSARVRLDLELEAPVTLDEVAGGHLYRIAQEAVGNAIRHGQADNISIALHSFPGKAILEIGDDGCGIPPRSALKEGFGLRSMRYRAQALDGTFEIEPRRDRGTRVRVNCPQPAS